MDKEEFTSMPETTKDDNRTVADMNVEGMPWYVGKKEAHHQKQIQRLDLTKEERRAMFKGLAEAMLPIALLAVTLFTVVYLFLYFVWLR